MEWGYVGTIAIVFTILLVISQRIVQRHQKTFRRFVYFIGVVVILRGNLLNETIIGFVFAALLAFLFWLLIGRYNPVGDDEENIKVYGMDD